MKRGCRSCGSDRLQQVLDLGMQRLSDFRVVLGNEVPEVTSPLFPLRLLRCCDCGLVQLSETVPPSLLYHDRYSFKSGVSEAIVNNLRNIVNEALAWQGMGIRRWRWLDIASNDGTLLSFVPERFHREGIDPLSQFANEARQHADRIIVDFFRPSYFDEPFDVITSISMFYDLDDPNEFIAGVKSVLARKGIWIVQQNYLLAMLGQNSIDNVSHEHLAYYSLASFKALLARHGLEINRVTLEEMNGGCFRSVISRAGTYAVDPTVDAILEIEGTDDAATWEAFQWRTSGALDDLRTLVREINSKGERVFVYGASTRGGTIWQAAGLDYRDLPFVVDRNPAKVGKYMTSIGAPIISEVRARHMKPEYMLVGPWWLKEQFVRREHDYLAAGGHLIIPLPQLEVVGG